MLNKFVKKVRKILSNLMKDKKKLLFVLSVLVAIVVVIVVLIMLFGNGNLLGKDSNSDEKKFKNEYEKLNAEVTEDGKYYPKVELPSNNNMKYSNITEVINIFKNDGDAVIYFGYPTCLYCRSAVQVLCDIALDTELDVIYYLDVEESDNNYKDLIELMGNKFTVDEAGTELYVPLVVFVTNGDIVSYNKGTLFSQKDPYTVLDDSQVQGLSEIYRYGIRDVLESIKLKNSVK